MKSCWIITKDHKNILEYRDIPQPQPKAGELVIKVHATALNRGELFVGGAVHGGPEKHGGGEASGVVHAMGDGVSGVKVGDAVFGRVRGGFAEYAVMDINQMMPKPERLSWEQAAAVPVSFIIGEQRHGREKGKRRACFAAINAGCSTLGAGDRSGATRSGHASDRRGRLPREVFEVRCWSGCRGRHFV